MASIWEAIWGPKSIPVNIIWSRILDKLGDARRRMVRLRAAADRYGIARRDTQRAMSAMQPGEARGLMRVKLDAMHDQTEPYIKRIAGLAADLDMMQRAVAAAQNGNRTHTVTPDLEDIIIEDLHFTELSDADVEAAKRSGVGGVFMALGVLGILTLIGSWIYGVVDGMRILDARTKEQVAYKFEIDKLGIEKGIPPEPAGPLFSIDGDGLAGILTVPVVAGLAGLWFIFGRGGRG